MCEVENQNPKMNQLLINQILEECISRRLKSCLRTPIFNSNYTDYQKRIDLIITNITQNWEKITPIKNLPLPLPEDLIIKYNEGSKRYQFGLEIHYDDKDGNACEVEIEMFCGSKDCLLDVLIDDLKDETLLYINPYCIVNNLKKKYKFITNYEETHNYPDENEISFGNIPLYDCDDCPICMDTFEMFNNDKCKRKTFCGHPLCYKCFDTIIKGDKSVCPTCRVDFKINDVIIEVNREPVDKEYIEMLQDENNIDLLLKMTNIVGVATDCIHIDGYSHMLRFNYFNEDDNDDDLVFATYEY